MGHKLEFRTLLTGGHHFKDFYSNLVTVLKPKWWNLAHSENNLLRRFKSFAWNEPGCFDSSWGIFSVHIWVSHLHITFFPNHQWLSVLLLAFSITNLLPFPLARSQPCEFSKRLTWSQLYTVLRWCILWVTWIISCKRINPLYSA